MTTATRLLLASLLLATACVDDKPVVQLKHVCAPPQDATTCSFDAECDATYLGENVFDVSLAPRLTLFVEAENQLLDNADPELGRVNTHDAYVQQVDVTYRGALALDPTSFLLQRMIPANGSSVLTLFPITEASAAQISGLGLPAGASAEIVAEVRLSGVLGDEATTFDTAAYQIPIRVCNGCVPVFGCADPLQFLVTCPPDLVTLAPLQGQHPLGRACVDP
jgi:hypothetical protein